jgi:hypothetical protein
MSRIAAKVYGIERHATLVDAAKQRLEKLQCKNVELRVGAGPLPPCRPDLPRLIERVSKAGLKPKPELAIQFGAAVATAAAELAAEDTRNAQSVWCAHVPASRPLTTSRPKSINPEKHVNFEKCRRSLVQTRQDC